MDRIGRGAIHGALAGLVATAFMSLLMLAARRVGLTPQLPPDRIAEEAIETVAGGPPGDGQQAAVASAAHFAFGAGAGALYGAATAPAARLRAPATVAAGLLFGTAVWLVSYQGWVPALKIMPPASRDHPGRVGTMLAAHWVFGAALALVTRRLR
jgi:hypothetical protein